MPLDSNNHHNATRGSDMNNESLEIELDDRPEVEYSIELYNTKYKRNEIYLTRAKDEKDVLRGLNLFTENGYEFLSIKRVHDDGHEPTREELERYCQLGAELRRDLIEERDREFLDEWER